MVAGQIIQRDMQSIRNESIFQNPLVLFAKQLFGDRFQDKSSRHSLMPEHQALVLPCGKPDSIITACTRCRGQIINTTPQSVRKAELVVAKQKDSSNNK